MRKSDHLIFVKIGNFGGPGKSGILEFQSFREVFRISEISEKVTFFVKFG